MCAEAQARARWVCGVEINRERCVGEGQDEGRGWFKSMGVCGVEIDGCGVWVEIDGCVCVCVRVCG